MKEFGFADIIRLTLSPGITSPGVILRSTYKHANYNIIYAFSIDQYDLGISEML